MMSIKKLMFMTTLGIGTLMAISSHSWLGVWMGLEINLLSFIPLMNDSMNKFSTEASIKYFITQAMASSVMILAIILSCKKTFMLMTDSTMINLTSSAVFTKMGAAPFHFWYPEVIEGLSWENCLILLTAQKIAPLIILSYLAMSITFASIVVIASMMVSGMLGINQTSLRKIMAFSSMNHIGWMIMLMTLNQSMWMFYFATYVIISMAIIFMFDSTGINRLMQLLSIMNHNKQMKLLLALNFLSLGGLPPFLGFLPKWMAIRIMVENNLIMLAFIMIVLTMIPLYIYTRMTFSAMMISMNELNKKLIMSPKTSTIMLSSISIMGLPMCTAFPELFL